MKIDLSILKYCDGKCILNIYDSDALDKMFLARKRLRDAASMEQERQAERMQKRAKSFEGSKFQLEPMDVVLVDIDRRDRGTTDFARLPCVVLCGDNDMYLLVCAAGVLKSKYHRSQVQYCSNANMNMFAGLKEQFDIAFGQTVKQMKRVSLCQANKKVSICGGRVHRCTCKGKCNNNSCSCKKNHVPCGSGCHSGMHAKCINK